MITVAIVEDIADIRQNICEFLNAREDMACIAAEGSMEGFLARLDGDNLPEVVLMDIGLPGMSGISGIQLLRERHPEINVIMFTVYNDSHKIFQSLCAGAAAYLLKNSPFREIEETIRIVHAGGSRMSPDIARKVVEYFHGDKPPAKSPLTAKEKEVVLALVDGLSYKMIAGQMNISLETVRSHIKNIYKKLHVHSKAEVIRKSLRGEI